MHDTPGYNGAAMVLLHLLRWTKANGSRPFSLLLVRQAENTREFTDVAPTWISEKSHWCPGGLRSQGLKALGFESLARRAEHADLHRFISRCPPALIYLNAFAASNFRLIEMLDSNIPMLTHVHEFGLLFLAQGKSMTGRILSRTQRFIACSGAVKKNLIEKHGIAPERIDVVHESIAVADVHAQRSRAEVLQELDFPDDSFLILGCGRAGWNKGTDVFIQLARVVCQQQSRARFAWVGAPATWEIPELEHDVRSMGLSDRLHFVGPSQKSADYLSAADVFALTSREDSFPLVCLEAAALGKPIVCFADAGGMPEFVENDCGFIAPYLDVNTMAQHVMSLLDCPGCREKMGSIARRKVAERHDVSIAAPKIAQVIEKTISEFVRA